MEASLYPAVREVFDPHTDSASGNVEIDGDSVPVTVGTEHLIDLFADVSSVAETIATGLVVEAGYSPREVDRVVISGFGSEGDSGNDITWQMGASFTIEDSAAADVGHGYPPERVYFGSELLPDVGAADVAREGQDLGRDIEVLETLDVEVS